MDILDFYYNKFQNALNKFRDNKTEENKKLLDIANRNYLTVLEGRESLI